MWWGRIVTDVVATKHVLGSISFCPFVEIFNEAIAYCPESLVFKEIAICLPSCLRNNFLLISQSMPILYL